MTYCIIYRVVGENGPFVSSWVFTKKQAKEIKKNIEKSPIFGKDNYYIEESSLLTSN